MTSHKSGQENTESSGYQYEYKKDFRTALPQFIAVSVKNLLLLGYGMTLGFPTILIPAVENPAEGEVLHLTKSEISWISSINLIVVPLGCAISGVVTTPLGRRRAMQAVNLPFFVAWLLFHFSATTGHLYGALSLTGLAGGLLEAPVLTYVAEVTQPHLRGALTATSSMCIIIGVFTQFLLGLYLYWRTVALVNIIFTILAVVALCFVPESPHWLVSRKRYNDAKKSLQWLRGWTDSKAVDEELKDIQALYKRKKVESNNEEETIREKLSNYTERSFIVPFLLVSYVFFVGHFCGMTTLQKLQAPINKYYATLILGLLQICGAMLCVLLVHYTGKRPLTLFSTGAAGLCALLVATYDGYITTHDVIKAAPINITKATGNDIIDGVDSAVNPYSWIPMVCLMLLALLSHTGIRLLPWILISEWYKKTEIGSPAMQFSKRLVMAVCVAVITDVTALTSSTAITAFYLVFSAKTRSGSAGLASAVGYIFGFLTNKMYISMVNRFAVWGTYGLYGVVGISGCIVLYFILPETEGKKLHDIENHFAGIKKLTNDVYRSRKRPKRDESSNHEMKGHVNSSFEPDDSKL